jgi:hypothetical protein
MAVVDAKLWTTRRGLSAVTGAFAFHLGLNLASQAREFGRFRHNAFNEFVLVPANMLRFSLARFFSLFARGARPWAKAVETRRASVPVLHRTTIAIRIRSIEPGFTKGDLVPGFLGCHRVISLAPVRTSNHVPAHPAISQPVTPP